MADTTRTGSPRARKVVQIAVADTDEKKRTILALCNDNTIWRWYPGGPGAREKAAWIQMEPVPGTEP